MRIGGGGGSCPVARSGVNGVETSCPASALLFTFTSVYQHTSVHIAESVLHKDLLHKPEHLCTQSAANAVGFV
jgi:hypothetical protein